MKHPFLFISMLVVSTALLFAVDERTPTDQSKYLRTNARAHVILQPNPEANSHISGNIDFMEKGQKLEAWVSLGNVKSEAIALALVEGEQCPYAIAPEKRPEQFHQVPVVAYLGTVTNKNGVATGVVNFSSKTPVVNRLAIVLDQEVAPKEAGNYLAWLACGNIEAANTGANHKTQKRLFHSR